MDFFLTSRIIKIEWHNFSYLSGFLVTKVGTTVFLYFPFFLFTGRKYSPNVWGVWGGSLPLCFISVSAHWPSSRSGLFAQKRYWREKRGICQSLPFDNHNNWAHFIYGAARKNGLFSRRSISTYGRHLDRNFDF